MKILGLRGQKSEARWDTISSQQLVATSWTIPGKPVSPALPRLSNPGSTDTTVARGTSLWESLVG